MTSNRLIAYLLGGLVFVASFFIYLEYIHLLGFPDGFITELGYAQRRLAYLFVGVSLLFGACFIYLGQIAPQTGIGQKLAITLMLYLIAALSIALIDYSYRLHLMDGTGG